MLYPHNFEDKIGFTQIRDLLSFNCSSALGKEMVDAMAFSDDTDTINEWQRQIEEFRRITEEHADFPMHYFFDVREAIIRVRPENTHLEEADLFDLMRSLSTIDAIVTVINDNPQPSALKRLTEDIITFPQIVRRISSILDKNGKVKDGASFALANIRDELKRTNSFVKEYGRYQRFFLDFKNNTGHDIDLKAGNVSVSAKYADGEIEQMEIVKLKEVISKINGQEVLSGLISIGTLAASAYTIGAVVGGGNITTDTWYNNASSTMFDVNNAAHMFLRDNPEKYKDVIKKYYLSDTSIKNGTTHGCMFNVKDKKKIERMTVKLNINGKEHNFDFTLKHQ